MQLLRSLAMLACVLGTAHDDAPVLRDQRAPDREARHAAGNEPAMQLLRWVAALAVLTGIRGGARGDDDPDAGATPAAPDPGTPPRGSGEVIEVAGKAPRAPGAISIGADEARKTAGALGEPFRALASLPGVTTSIAALGYPIIRGTLPGESRFEFDGIELPMLYHLLIGNQVIHPAFLGDIELRAGGYGAEHGQMLGGLVTMTPADPIERTEVHASPVEVGAYRAQRLSQATAIAAAFRGGTLGAVAKIYSTQAAVDYFDQQARLVHRLGNGDELTLTSLGSYDFVREPPDGETRTERLAFHRLDARWTRRRALGSIRAGAQSELDMLGTTTVVPAQSSLVYDKSGQAMLEETPQSTERRRASSWGVRGYADASLSLGSALTVRTGAEARHRALTTRGEPFTKTAANDPYLAPASSVDSASAWAALDLRIGRVTVTPSVRGDDYRTAVAGMRVHHTDVDPRVAVTAELPGGGRAELAGGIYTAPPQASLVDGSLVIGPIPATDGTASASGMSRGVQAQTAVRLPLGESLQGSLAAYYRDTDYAVDFAMLDKAFTGELCSQSVDAQIYRHIDVRAMGLEAMLRRQLGHDVSGWLSYTLGKIDRDFGFIELPHDFDQRHTLNAALQWQRGRWRYGASGHLYTGRPVPYPRFRQCSGAAFPAYSVITSDPTYLRRLPTNWRIDLRIEREIQYSGWKMRVYFEMQNASLTHEVTGYQVAGDLLTHAPYVRESSLFLPLPLFGVEADL